MFELLQYTFIQHPAPGFLNGYCMNDPYNDRAEVFAAYMVPDMYKRASRLFSGDRFLKKKFDRIRRELTAFFPGFSKHYDPEKILLHH